jgi:hypothetical protein
MAGAILLVSALIFGALAGGIVVQRLNLNPAASSEQDRSDETGGSDTKTKQPNEGNQDTQEPDDSQDKDA